MCNTRMGCTASAGSMVGGAASESVEGVRTLLDVRILLRVVSVLHESTEGFADMQRLSSSPELCLK